MLAVLRVMGLGILGFVTPRILVGAGVPLDVWAIDLGEWLGLSRPWVEEWGLTVIGLFIGFTFSSIEVWWHPAQRIWNKTTRWGHKDSPVSERKPITELRGWAIEAGWDADIYSNVVGENDFFTFKTRLEQVAADGEIQFWGRKYPHDIPDDLKDSQVLTEIDREHFKDFQFDVQQLAEAENYDIFTCKLGTSRDQLQGQCFRDLHIDAGQARAWLKEKGKAPPGASFRVRLVASPGKIGGYDCICAVIVQSVEKKDLAGCLVQVEEISITYPDQMPMPLVLRTDGQIRDSRKGRFKLSPNQPESVPILFRSNIRNNEWFFFDENETPYLISARQFRLVLGIYGGKSSGKALVDVLVGDDWTAYPSLKIVSDDFVFSEATDSEAN